MMRRKTKHFSWRFVQFVENGTTRDVKIFLWNSWRKKSCCMKMLQNVTKSKNMPSRKFLWSYHSLRRNNTHYKKRTVLLRAAHIWKIILANFETIKKVVFVSRKFAWEMSPVEFICGKVTDTAACNFLEKNSIAIVSQNFPIHFKQSKWKKLPLLSWRSQENVHDDVQFWSSYCYSQLFKKELHYSSLEGLLQKYWNKINKKVVSAFSSFQRKCLYKEVHFCRSYWVLPAAFCKRTQR